MQKGANLAELEKCCVMRICSYGSASREPRTSPPKIWPNNNLKNFGKFSRNLNAYSRMDLKCVDSVARRAARDTFSLSHFQFRFFPPKDACKSDRSCQELSNGSLFKRVFSCKNRLRYENESDIQFAKRLDS